MRLPMLKKMYVMLFALLSTAFSNQCENEPKRNYPENAQTTKDLHEALSGEAQANRKYLAFAQIAEAQGYPQIARLWKAAAAAEAIHAKNYMEELGMLNSTEENLKNAVEGEQNEFSEMYPRFIKTAEKEGYKCAAQKMQWAYEVEQIHHKLFLKDLNDLKQGKRPKDQVYWICSVCGNTVPANPPQVCNICGAPRSKFFEIK